MRYARLFCVSGVLGALAAVAAGQQTSSTGDWPQWRGPTRDGVAPPGPRLLDSWPKQGPHLVWKSAPIPSTLGESGHLADAGGSASVVVSGGQAFVFVHWKHPAGKMLISTQMLRELGWEEGVPDHLAKAIEDARLSDKRKDLSAAALDAYMKDFTASLDPELAKKFGDHIRVRLTQGREALSWDKDFAHLAKARDRQFSSYDELFQAVDRVFRPGTHGNPGSDKIIRLFVDPFMSKVFRYSDTIICLDAGSGTELWRKEFPGVLPERELNWGASATPAVVGDRMYIAGSAGLYCLAVKDGALVWHTKAALGHSSPLVADGHVYIYEGGPAEDRYKFFAADALAAFSAEDGKLLWRQPKVGRTNGSVVLWVSGGSKYIISGAPGGPYCVDPATGDVLWERPKGSPGVQRFWTCDGTPAISGDIVVLYADPLMAFRITPQKAELLWQYRAGENRGSSPVICQDHVYFFGGHGEAICMELQTGAVKWQQKKITGETASPVVADGKLFYFPVLNDPGWAKPSNIGMFRASPDRFEELARFPAWTSEHSSPTIVGGRLYVRMRDHVACYDLTAAGNRQTGQAAEPATVPSGGVEPIRPLAGRLSFPPPSANQATGPTTAPTEPADWSKNWPRFRGPSGNGAPAPEADPPVKFDLAKDTIFSVAVPAAGHSSPIVWGDRVFLTGEGQRIMAFARSNGKLLWDTALKAPPPTTMPGDEKARPPSGSTGLAAPTPCTDGQRVYAFFGTGVLGCVGLEGQQIWAERLVLGKPRSVYGLAASPVLYGDLVIQVVDQGATPADKLSFMVALRAKDGVAAWGQDRPVRSAWSTPLLYRGPTGDELVTAALPWVIAYQPRTGAELWRAGELHGDVAASPVAGKGMVYAPSGDGGNEVLAIRTGGRGDVTKTGVAWTAEVPIPDASSPICDGQRYYHISSGGELHCLDAATGKKLWAKVLAGQYWASPVLVGRRLYVVDSKGSMSVIATADGQLLSTVSLPEGVTASPAVHGGRIYLRTTGHLMCIGRD